MQRASEAALLFGALLLASCVSLGAPIEIDQGGVASFNVRATLPFGDQEGRAGLAEGRPEDGVGAHSSFEFEFTGLGGEGDQTLASGEAIGIDDEVFAGPGEVEYDFQVITFALTATAMRVYEPGFAIGGFMGLSSHTLNLDGKFAGARDSVDILSFGPYLGTEVAWYAPAPFHLFGRLTTSFEWGDERDTVQTGGIEVGGAYHFGRTFSLGAGWRWWSYEAEGDGVFGSDVELEINGPLITLGFAP